MISRNPSALDCHKLLLHKHKKDFNTLETIEEFITQLSTNKLFHTNMKGSEALIFVEHDYLYISVTNIPIDFFITEVCPILRAAYNCIWTLNVVCDGFKLDTRVKGIPIYIFIYKNELDGCIINKLPADPVISYEDYIAYSNYSNHYIMHCTE
jgi:hypothetical protein